MLEYNDIHTYLLKGGAVATSTPKKDLLRYTLNGEPFAYVSSSAKPTRISLRCDTILAQSLVERYETVMPGQNLDPKKWITIVLSGQLEDQDVFDLVAHAESFTRAE